MSMTESEEIERILYMGVGRSGLENENSCIAKALKELKQYRAIGTVEGYERAIQISQKNYKLYREYKSKVQEYEDIGTVSELLELKEKATAKKAVLRKGVYHCPSCGMAYAVVLQGYCTFCGQHMN